MKALILLTLLLLISCGTEVPRVDQSFSGVGNFITADESLTMTSSEKSNLQLICNSLNSKEAFVSNYIINNTFSATYTQSNSVCGADATNSEVVVEIVKNSGDLEFESTSGGDPQFDIVETDSNGTVEKFCEQVTEDEVKSQVLSGQNILIGRVIGANGSGCSGSDVACFILEYAQKTDDGRYRVTQAVKLTVNTDSGDQYVGMVNSKELSEICTTESSKRTSRSMSLKSVN